MNHKSESEVWVNGVFGAGVPADDPGLLFGLTVFETFRTYHGRPFRLREHLDRLVVSAAAMNIAIADVAIIEAQVLAICQGDVSIRYTVTAGGLAANVAQDTLCKLGCTCQRGFELPILPKRSRQYTPSKTPE